MLMHYVSWTALLTFVYARIPRNTVTLDQIIAVAGGDMVHMLISCDKVFLADGTYYECETVVD